MAPWLREIEGFEGLLMPFISRDRRDPGDHLLGEPRGGGEARGGAASLRDWITSTVDVEAQETADYELAFADVPALRSS